MLIPKKLNITQSNPKEETIIQVADYRFFLSFFIIFVQLQLKHHWIISFEDTFPFLYMKY